MCRVAIDFEAEGLLDGVLDEPARQAIAFANSISHDAIAVHAAASASGSTRTNRAMRRNTVWMERLLAGTGFAEKPAGIALLSGPGAKLQLASALPSRQAAVSRLPTGLHVLGAPRAR